MINKISPVRHKRLTSIANIMINYDNYQLFPIILDKLGGGSEKIKQVWHFAHLALILDKSGGTSA